MAEANPDDQLVQYYRSRMPYATGATDQQIIRYAMAKDPEFRNKHSLAYGPTMYNDQNKLANVVGSLSDATQPIRDGLSQAGDIYNAVHGAVSRYTPSGMMERDALKAFHALNQGTDLASKSASDEADKMSLSGKNKTEADIFNHLSYALDLAKLPDTPAQVAGAVALGTLGAKLNSGAFKKGPLDKLSVEKLAKGGGDVTPETSPLQGSKLDIPELNPATDSIHLQDTSNEPNLSVPKFPSTEKVAINPESGKLEKVNIPDAEALSKSEHLFEHDVHGGLAKQHVGDMLKASKSYVDNLWSDVKSAIANEPGAEVDTAKVGSLANHWRETILQAPEFQTSAMKKMLDKLGFDEPEVAEGEPKPKVKVTMSVQEAASYSQSLGEIAAKNYKNPTGHLAKELQDAMRSVIQKDAPESIKEPYNKAIEVSANHYKTFYNDSPVQRFLNTANDKASGFAIGDLDKLEGSDLTGKELEGIKRAGGEVAMEHLRRSEGAKLISKIVKNDWDGADVKQHLWDNKPLSHLLSNGDYSNMTGERFAEIADRRTANQSYNTALDEMDKLHHNGIVDNIEFDDKLQGELDKAREATEKARQSLLDSLKAGAREGANEVIRQKYKSRLAEEARINSIKAEKLVKEIGYKQKIINAMKNFASSKTGGLVGGPAKAPIIDINDLGK